MARYPYQALDLPHETRILHIQPGKFEDEIVCSLVHMSLKGGSSPYEALSYCWGRSTNVEFIPPDDAIVSYAFGSEDGESGQIPFRDMLDHPELHRTYVNFGGRLPPGNILCDGVSVEVGGELLRAIQRIRREAEVLRIWIDALCIDQENIEERNEHVLMMGRVYAGASHVRIWLGEDTGIDGQGLLVLEGIVNIAESIGEAQFRNLGNFEIRKRLLTDPRTTELDWESLHQFFDRAWFHRIWVLQEAANASRATVHVGSWTVDWDWLAQAVHFAKAFKMDMVLKSFALKSLGVMQWLRNDQTESNEPIAIPLLDLLEETRVFESTLPADKIYAVLSLADQTVDAPVDYAMGAEESFTQLAVQFLEEKQSLDILSHCMLPAMPSKLKLPSWVPDWTVHGWVEPLRSRALKATAAGTSKPRMRISKDRSQLLIWGKVLGSIEAIESTKTITHLANTPKGLAGPKFGIRKLDLEQDDAVSLPHNMTLQERNLSRQSYHREEARATLYDIYRVASPTGTPSQKVRESLARAFACNRTRDGSDLGADFMLGFDLHSMVASSNDTFEAVSRWMIQEATGASETSRVGRAFGKRMMKAFEEWTGSHEKWCFNRRFIRTTDSLGWAVNGAKVGDVVALLYGGSYPFVLREQEQGKFTIVGDCYLDRYMEGQGLDPAYVEQEFVII
ncbi:ankyrin and het domain-containing protein [Cordyceps javanica]|uniref:Ankyrin and het domain-containing protein n=1 Tax=Cordyceps javanica TaxID=43265 RepID=A0A545URA4_9HYPO|nr:ankyrin and het domain-containing protein [Cordyceps javanica]TQW03944.1 ankyrin and het domain-containing protein [Cordyceps javanica]